MPALRINYQEAAMGQNKFDPTKAQQEVTKAIQGLMDACHFHTKADAGHVSVC